MEFTRAALGLVPRFEQEGFASERDRIDAYLTEAISLLKQRAEGRMESEEPRFAELRRELLGSSFLAQDARDFLTRHRTLQQLWDRTLSQHRSYRERREVIDTAFESTIARLEQGGSTLVELDENSLHDLNMGEARRLWDKATRRLIEDDDADGALTLTRTLLETVCKKILDAFGATYSSGDTAQNLCKRALDLVVPASVRGREHFRQFNRSTLNIVENISLYRAEQSDAHGTALDKDIETHQAAYAVNLAGSTAIFLIECYRTTRIDAPMSERNNPSAVDRASRQVQNH